MWISHSRIQRYFSASLSVNIFYILLFCLQSIIYRDSKIALAGYLKTVQAGKKMEWFVANVGVQ